MTIDTMVMINKPRYALKVMLGITQMWRRCRNVSTFAGRRRLLSRASSPK